MSVLAELDNITEAADLRNAGYVRDHIQERNRLSMKVTLCGTFFFFFLS